MIAVLFLSGAGGDGCKGYGNRSWQVLAKNINSPTEPTIEASVMNGVQKAFQRARRRSSLSSSEVFLGDGGSTIVVPAVKSLLALPVLPLSAWLLSGWYIMSGRPKSNKRARDRECFLVNPAKFD